MIFFIPLGPVSFVSCNFCFVVCAFVFCENMSFFTISNVPVQWEVSYSNVNFSKLPDFLKMSQRLNFFHHNLLQKHL